MSELRKSPFNKGGRKGVIIHDKLCADGPVDPETGKPLIDPATGEPFPGKNDDMAFLMHDYLVMLRSQIMLGSNMSQTVPRFGVLSLLALHTPIYVYDHPAFKKVANTAFTDGIHVFVDADFMRTLVEQEEDTDGRESGVIFLLMHELMHKLLYHVDRLKNFPPRIANIAEDMVINGKLVKGFPSLKPVKLLSEIGYGMKSEEADKYYSMAEEIVAEMLMVQERQKKQKEQKGKQKGQQGGGGGGQGQGSGSGGEGEGEGDEQSNEKGNKDSGGQGGEDGEDEEYNQNHTITPEELLDILEKEGLQDTVGKALDLPQRDDVEGIGKLKEKAKMHDVDAVQKALSQAAQAGGQYPGQHIAEHASEVIGGLDKGKITWKLALKKQIMGDGQKLSHTDDEAHITWLLDKETMGIDPFYSGALVPHAPDETVLVLVDTSGSTSGGNMRKEFLQECLSLKRNLSNASDVARKVILFSADTVLRGEPLEITDANVEKLRHEGVPIFGNGGTDFVRVLNEALELPIIKKEKVKATIYFTDCLDQPPTRADFEKELAKGMKFVFITTPGMWNETWNKQVGDWAEVYCIEEGTQVNFDKDEITKDTRKNNMR